MNITCSSPGEFTSSGARALFSPNFLTVGLRTSNFEIRTLPRQSSRRDRFVVPVPFPTSTLDVRRSVFDVRFLSEFICLRERLFSGCRICRERGSGGGLHCFLCASASEQLLPLQLPVLQIDNTGMRACQGVATSPQLSGISVVMRRPHNSEME